jgi:RNA polymerase sigma-70 factor (ECF subfamily)
MNEQRSAVPSSTERWEDSWREDSIIVARAQENKDEAIVELWHKYHGPVFGYALKVMGNPHDAEDIVQSTFTTVCAKIDTFEDRGKGIGGWLRTIAHNNCVNLFDRSERRNASLNDIEDNYSEMSQASLFKRSESPEDPESIVVRRQMLGWVATELENRTSSSQKRIQSLYLTEVEGYKNREVAGILDIAKGTVESGRSRLRDTVLELLDDARANPDPDMLDSLTLAS